MTETFSPTHRVHLRYPEDEGFARRQWQGSLVRITAEPTLPDDPRYVVITEHGARGMFADAELVALIKAS